MVGVANTARREMQRLAAEFGLSPSARTQIAADPLLNDPISRKYFGSLSEERNPYLRGGNRQIDSRSAAGMSTLRQ
jgi:phage terminase small subunit